MADITEPSTGQRIDAGSVMHPGTKRHGNGPGHQAIADPGAIRDRAALIPPPDPLPITDPTRSGIVRMQFHGGFWFGP